MDSYTGFAEVYDTFMDETPYGEWADYISQLILQYGISQPSETEGKAKASDKEQEALCSERNLVVELGCGTGNFTQKMAEKGYDMIGIDNSSEMLDIALKKKEKSNQNMMYLEQDMREIDLYSTAGTFISVCDSINYLLEDDDVRRTFALVNNYLYPGGIFIFDFNTIHKYRDVIGDTTIAEDRDNCSFIWDNYYHADEAINEYDLTIFVAEEYTNKDRVQISDGGLFRKFMETHYQRGYTLDEMKHFVEEAGMQFVTAIDAEKHSEVTEKSERVYVIAREQMKKNLINAAEEK